MDRTPDNRRDQRRMVVLTPTFTPVGGVVKVFDYVKHALDAGWSVEIGCPEPIEDAKLLREISHIDHVLDVVEHHQSLSVPIGIDDLVLFSWPHHYMRISANLPRGFRHEQIIHLVQNVRHANPNWVDGFPTRLLGRPLTRIMITEEVDAACRPWINPNSITETIIEGHAADFFARERSGGLRPPIRVGYTTWKSEVGIAVEEALADDGRFRFESIREPAGWSRIRKLYHRSDVFLGCPGREEGFYLVGLEAMAAGAILIMSDAVGNRAYGRWGENCHLVDHDDADGYVQRLQWLADADDLEIESMRAAGYATVPRFSLANEAEGFRRVLDRIESHRLSGAATAGSASTGGAGPASAYAGI